MQTLKGRISWVLAHSVDTVLPPRCVVTGDPVEVQGMMTPRGPGRHWIHLPAIL